MIRDQRTMSGSVPLWTAEGIRAFWAQHGATQGFVRHGERVLTSELIDAGITVPAYVDAGRWVSPCPLCNGGIACWPENPDGACLTCGTVYRIRFPDPSTVQDAVAALEARPEENRHWHPHTGESPRDLRRDNIRNGYVPTIEAGRLEDVVPKPPKVEERLRALHPDDPGAAERAIDDLRRRGLI